MDTLKLEQEKELYNAFVENKAIDASPCSVYFGPCGMASPRRTTGPTRSSTRGGWTEEEDYLLAESVRKFNRRQWKKIAECLPGRTVPQCFCRWDRVLNPSIVKGTWTKEEDDYIMELVRKYGCRKWSVIAKFLPGRLGKQCRERWYNHLDPAINRSPWTEDEEMTLAYYHEIYGNKWAEIASFLPGRTENAIKNHWNCIMKKLDLYSSHGCTMELFTIGSPYSYNCTAEPDGKKLNEERQGLDSTVCDYENRRLNYNAKMSNSELVDDVANSRLFLIEAKRVAVATGRSPERVGEVRDQIKFDFTDADADAGTTGSGRNIDNHENIHSPLVASDVGPSFDVPSSTGSPIRIRGHVGGRLQSRFGYETENSFPNTSTSGYGQENGLDRKTVVHKMHIQTEDTSPNCLHKQSPQPKDLVSAIVAGEFPSGDNHAIHQTDQFCFTSPTKFGQSISVNSNSPASILRNLARTFKSTPSIIRKRTFRDAGIAKFPDATCTSSPKMTCMNDQEAVNGTDILKVKQFCKLESSFAFKSKRYLGHAFDMEKNAASGKCRKSVSVSASLDVNIFGKEMVMPSLR